MGVDPFSMCAPIVCNQQKNVRSSPYKLLFYDTMLNCSISCTGDLVAKRRNNFNLETKMNEEIMNGNLFHNE